MKHILTYFCLICVPILIISGNLNAKEDFPVLKGPYLGQKPPGMKPEVFAPGIVSTKDHIEMGFTCTSDGREIYFARSESRLFQETANTFFLKQMAISTGWMQRLLKN